MKQTVNLNQFRDAFISGRPDNFSYEGLGVLFDWIEELDESCGTETELDVIAFCCDFCEYENIEEYVDNYGLPYDDCPFCGEEIINPSDYTCPGCKESTLDKGAIYDDIQNKTQLIEVNNDSFIIQNY